MSASQTPPESSTVALGWLFSFPQQALFLPALGSVPCFTTPWSNPHESSPLKLFPSVRLQAELHPRWSDKSPQGRGQSWFLLFLNSCSIYHILVTRPFLAANCDSKSSSLHIARAHGGWGHQQVSNTKWLPLSFFVASFLSCLKVHGDFFYPTNAIYCQKQPRDWAVHGLIISSSASFLCCWWSAPNLSKDRLLLSEAQCVASGWGRYSEVLGINNKM